MANIMIIGTSHTTDEHAYQLDDNLDTTELQKQYCLYEDGAQTWTEYLVETLNMNAVNIAVGGIGIDTYTPRILSVKDDYNIALLEIPSRNRHELYVQQDNENYMRNYLFDSDLWQDMSFADEIVRFSTSDYRCANTTINKISRVNERASYPLSKSDFKASIRNKMRHNNHLLDDNIYGTITMINGYLKSKNVVPIWFSYDFDLKGYDFKDFMLINEQIEFKTIKEYLQYDSKNKDFFGDGIHLNSKYWRKLADDLFVNFIERKKNG
jgi:hypothetical protein